MIAPDVYYGPVATNYEASREVKAKWKAENAAVERFLTHGPVLDVPFGTGRFVPLYRAKGLKFTGIDISSDMLAMARQKYPDANARLGSAFNLQFAANEFGTAVCVRFLEWLPIERALVVLNRLRCIAGTLIVTITHGNEGKPEAYTYDFGRFLYAINGLLIEDRCVTAHVRDMISEIFKLRPARWSDVLDQFRFDYPDDAEENIQRIADKFAGFVSLPPVPIRQDTVTVRAEYWSGDKIAAAWRVLRNHRFETDLKPRREDGPITVVERDRQLLIIDGRHRANVWMHNSGPHPVLVVRPV